MANAGAVRAHAFPPLFRFPHLSAAVESYIRAQDTGRPMRVIDNCVGRLLNHDGTLDDLFKIPIRDGILSHAAALEWLFFLSQAVTLAVRYGDDVFDGDGLHCDWMLDYVARAYVASAEEIVLSHFAYGPDGDESDDVEADAGIHR